MCKIHVWPPLNQFSTNIPWCTQYTAIFHYCPVFYSLLECECLLNKHVAHGQISLFYCGMVVTKLDNAGCIWRGSWMVWMLIIHVLYMCAKSNVCILCKSWSISGRLIQRWSRVHFARNIICSSWVVHMHFMSSLMWIEDQILRSCAHVKLASGMTDLLSDSSATRASMLSIYWAVLHVLMYIAL